MNNTGDILCITKDIRITCFSDMGKVSKPHSSGVLTTSLVTSLQDLQTAAQDKTALLAGQIVSLASTLPIISRSNSVGMLAHGLGSPNRYEDEDDSSGVEWKCLWSSQFFFSVGGSGFLCFPFFPLRSLKMDLNCIFTIS